VATGDEAKRDERWQEIDSHPHPRKKIIMLEYCLVLLPPLILGGILMLGNHFGCFEYSVLIVAIITAVVLYFFVLRTPKIPPKTTEPV
jgi:hypothetical protein